MAQSTEEVQSKPERARTHTELWIFAALAGAAIIGVCVLAVALALILGKGSFIQVNPTITSTLPVLPAAPAPAISGPQRYSAPENPLAQRGSAQDRVQPALPGALASPTPQSGRRDAELVRADTSAPPSPAFPGPTPLPTAVPAFMRVQNASGVYARNGALPMPPVPHPVEEAPFSGSQPQRAPMGAAAEALQAMASGPAQPARSPASDHAVPTQAPTPLTQASAPVQAVVQAPTKAPTAPPAAPAPQVAAAAPQNTPAAPPAKPSPQVMAASEPSANAEPTVAVVTNIPFATTAPTLGAAQSTSAAALGAAASLTPAAKGDLLYAGGLGQGSLADLRVLRARSTLSYGGQDAPKGNRYFVADLMVTNKAAAPLSVDSGSYDLRDADGNSYMANPESDPSQVPAPVKNGVSAPMSVNFLVPDDVNLKSLALVLPSETDLVPLLKQ